MSLCKGQTLPECLRLVCSRPFTLPTFLLNPIGPPAGARVGHHAPFGFGAQAVVPIPALYLAGVPVYHKCEGTGIADIDSGTNSPLESELSFGGILRSKPFPTHPLASQSAHFRAHSAGLKTAAPNSKRRQVQDEKRVRVQAQRQPQISQTSTENSGPSAVGEETPLQVCE